MKRMLLLYSIAVLFVSSASFADKRYTIERVRIHATIDSSGGAWIDESRTYDFKGRFTHASYELPLRGIADISNISVSEAGRAYLELNGDDKEKPGSFRVEREGESVDIRWYYQGEDEARTFTLRFYLKAVAIAHADVAEFYYKFIGTGWDHASARVEVTVQLPATIPTNDMRIWAHGPLHGTCSIVAPGIARFDVAPLPARTFWEGRVVFPRSFLSAAHTRTHRVALPGILERERAWAEEANRRREAAIRKGEEQRAWREQNLPWLIAANLGGLMLLFYLYHRHGRSLVTSARRLEMSPPQDLPPGLANYYYVGPQLSAGALVSTLIDLARRGFLTISEASKDAGFLGWRWKKSDYIMRFQKHKIDDSLAELHPGRGLRPHEKELLRYLQSEIAQGADSIPFSAIAKSQSKFMKWFGTWRAQIKKLVENKKYYDPQSVRAAIKACLAMLLLIGLGVFATVNMGERGIPFILYGAVLAGLSFVIIRYSAETATQRGRLLGFRDYLKRLAKNQSSSVTWNLQSLEPVLVYAMAVDFPSHLLKKFLQLIQRDTGTLVYPWYIYGHNGAGRSGFAEAMAGMMSAASTAMSSASGTGGGASGGGGGGAGGSGGGAG